MHMRSALGVAALAALLATAPAAFAVETTGRGENVSHVKNIPFADGSRSGTDIEFHSYTIDGAKKTFAFAGSYKAGLMIVDVTDPADAQPVATYDCGVSQGDVQIFDRDGRTYVAYTHDTGYTFDGKHGTCRDEAEALGFTVPSGSFGTYIADVSDPYHPATVSFVSFPKGSHNQTVHPSGRYLYNSNSDLLGTSPAIEIADITDLSHPKALPSLPLQVFPGLGSDSHDIKFNASGTRAYVAAISHSEVLDTTDPAHPVSIGKILDPYINVHHQSETATLTDPVLGTRDFLFIEDEFAGATGTGECPSGGVFVYDVTGDLEKTPVRVGYWNISDAGPAENGLGTCTAHVFQLHAKEKLMTLAYYNAGVRVVDLSGLVGVALGNVGVGMKQLGFYRFKDSNAWSVKAPSVSRDGFYMFADDHSRGFDVYRYQPSPAAATVTDEWLSGARLDRTLRYRQALTGRRGGLQPVCLLL